MSNNRLLDFALTFAAKIDPSLTRAFKATNASLNQLNKSINATELQKKQLDQIFSQQRATLTAAQNFAKMKERLESLGAQMKASKQPNAELSSEYAKQQLAVKRASVALEEQKSTLQRLKAESGLAGKSLQELTQRQKELENTSRNAQRMASLNQKIEGAQSSRASYGAQFAIGAGQMMLLKSLASNFAAPIKLGMEFDKTMARVGAVSNASAEDLGRLRDKARELGASTVFSASQAAEGMTYLAMAGFKTDDMLKAMPGMLNLASAGQVDLANASDIAASMLNGFGLEASQINRVADTMVNTFANSSTDLQGLGETMKYVAPVAASMGVDLETVAAMAGKLGDNAIRGSQAGTAMRAVFTRLVAPATEGQKALYALGVSVKDAQGNVRAMPDVLKDIGTALQKLPQAAQAAIKKDIFGQEAMSAAGILMNNAVDGTLQKFIDKVKEAGSAERVAKEQTNNLDGDLASLNSAFEETQLTLSEAVTPAIRKCTVWLTKAVGAVGAFAKNHETLLKVLMAVGVSIGGIIAMMATFNMIWGGAGYIIMSAVAGALKLWKVLMLLKNAILIVKSAMIIFNAVMFANPIGLVIAAIAALIAIGVLLYKNWDLIKEKAAALWSWFSEKCPWLANLFSSAFNNIVENVSSAWNRIKYHFTQVIDFVKNIFAGEWGKAWENVKNIFANIFGGLVGLAKLPINGIISVINKAFSAIGSVSVSIPDWVPSMGGQTLSFEMPQIPMLANGGIVTKPTTALIGEGAESEAVLPLSKLESLLAGHSSSAGSSNITINFNPTINVTTDGKSGDAYDQIRRALAEGSSNFQKQIEQYFAQRSRLSYE
ncbi:MAG: phage tail tape measure protein [Succinivibrio sp.]|uniref:phage tail tape measure protein n=1 Tax=Succinivibrio sp. TaxID=2053619 RepID=UPI002F9297D9